MTYFDAFWHVPTLGGAHLRPSPLVMRLTVVAISPQTVFKNDFSKHRVDHFNPPRYFPLQWNTRI